MSRSKILFLAVTLILALSACSAPSIALTTIPTSPQNPQSTAESTQALPPVPTPTIKLPASDAEVPRVAVADAKAAFDVGQAIIIDVRTKQAFDLQHIKGAKYLGDLEDSQRNLTVPKNQWIITYCT